MLPQLFCDLSNELVCYLGLLGFSTQSHCDLFAGRICSGDICSVLGNGKLYLDSWIDKPVSLEFWNDGLASRLSICDPASSSCLVITCDLRCFPCSLVSVCFKWGLGPGSPYIVFDSEILWFFFSCQVVILHHMLSKATVKARPSVLWCYKKELGFSR